MTTLATVTDDGAKVLDQAFERLERDAPDRLSRGIRWLRDPRARRVRIPLGLLFLIGGCLWFLPVVGLELIPVGLLLIAQDVPFLRKPVGKGTLWLEDRWQGFRRRWRARREARRRHGARLRQERRA